MSWRLPRGRPGYILPWAYPKLGEHLYRLNLGEGIALQPGRPGVGDAPHARKYDVETDERGYINPVPVEERDEYFQHGPYGMAMMRNGPYLHALLQKPPYCKRDDLVIYEVLRGIHAPDGLELVHERGDFYSLRPIKPMHIDTLNETLNTFLERKGNKYTKAAFLSVYPEPLPPKRHGTITRSIMHPEKNSKVAREVEFRDRWKTMHELRFMKGKKQKEKEETSF